MRKSCRGISIGQRLEQIYKVGDAFTLENRGSGRKCLTNGKAMGDLRVAREVEVLFSALAAVRWCPEIKLRKLLDEFLWLIMH